jgi:hypothetical protein
VLTHADDAASASSAAPTRAVDGHILIPSHDAVE